MARDRLTDRIAKQNERWKIWRRNIHPDPIVDQATAEFVDPDGLLWIHSYLTWPHLTVYSIISGPRDLVRNQQNWAIQALKSLCLIKN